MRRRYNLPVICFDARCLKSKNASHEISDAIVGHNRFANGGGDDERRACLGKG
jgi:hypothetical protein